MTAIPYYAWSKRVKGITICFLLLVMVTAAMPQGELRFKHLNVTHGLSQNSVLEVFRDHLGFVWFGTRTGLDRFDGISIESFLQDPEDSISINYGFIMSIVEDQGGDLWIGSMEGLYHYDRSMEKFSKHLHDPEKSESIGSNNIVHLVIDKLDRLWVCHSKGIDIFNAEDKSFTHIFNELDTDLKVDLEKLFDVAEDDNGRIWVSSGTELFQIKWDQKQIKRYEIPFVYSNSGMVNEETSLFVGATGKIWIAGLNGQVFSFSDDDDQLVRESVNISPECSINCISEDLEGNLLVGTSDGGLFVFDKDNGTTVQYIHDPFNQQSLSNNDIYSIFSDKDGTIWTGNWQGGVNFSNKYDKAFDWVEKNIGNPNSLINNYITAFYQDNSENIWIGTYDGISKWNLDKNIFENNFSRDSNTNFFKGMAVGCFLELNPGTIWAGTSIPGGLFEININHLSVEPVKYLWDNMGILEDALIMTLDKDLDGVIWLGTRSGIYRMNITTQTIRSYNSANSALRENSITCSYIDKQGVIWFGTSSGLFMYDKNNDDFIYISSFFPDNSSSPKWIYSIFEDDLGQFWVGTAGYGLVLYNRESGDWDRFTTKDGLPSNVITGILEDDIGNLWISTYKGISQFNSIDKTVRHSYDSNDGLRNIEFQADCGLFTKSQEILFGGVNGFTIIIPKYLKDNINVPKIVFKELRIANKQAKPGQRNSPLKESISQTKEISLKHNQKHFSISFVALNLIDASKNNYLTYLEGYDDDWSSPVTTGIVYFDNMKSGKYTFHVKASNNDGVWNEEGISLHIRMHPPWWFAFWAYGIYFSIFVALLLLYANLVRNREKEKQIAQGERKEKEKIRELNKARLQFFTEIAHDFKTPLSLIISPIEQLNRYHSNDKNFERLLGLISRNAKRLNYLSGELMTFRKLEMGQINLEKHDRDIVSYIQRIIYEFTPLINRKKIHFNFNYDNSPVILSFDEERMERVICNLLDNAIKYTAVEGTIRIEIESKPKVDETKISSISENIVIIRLFNSGQPFSNEDLERIFDRFYQGGKLRKPGFGHGIGLPLVKGLVELHQGSIEVRNIPGEGKEFVIRLPMSTSEEEFISTQQPETNEISEITPLEIKTKSEVLLLESHKQNNKGEGELPLILLVEDNEEFREYLGSNLNQNYRIITGSDGSQGFVKAIKNMPDLIISDIMMPIMDGLEFCKKLKEDLRTCHIPVILLTSKAEIEHRIEGLEIGADAYITKPFINKHLEIQIQNLIDTRLLLARKFSSGDLFSPEEVFTNKIDQEFLNNAISFVQNNIDEDELGIDILGSHLCVSRRHLYRKIKVLTGSSPVEFIKVIRLRKSMELLTENAHSISEIGYMVGFNNPSYFAQSFKKLYGHPPSFFVK